MINVLSGLGLLLLLLGAWLVLKGLAGALRQAARRHVYRKRPLHVEGEGIYSGAVTAREVYVPGNVFRRLGKALGGVLVAALGAPLLWAGVALGAYVRVDQPARIATVELGRDGIRVEPVSGGPVSGRLQGGLVVAHAEYLEFDPRLAALGLGRHVRLTHLASYARSADVLSRRGIDRIDVAAPQALSRLAERWQNRTSGAIRASRRFSSAIEAGAGRREIWASADGVVFR